MHHPLNLVEELDLVHLLLKVFRHDRPLRRNEFENRRCQDIYQQKRLQPRLLDELPVLYLLLHLHLPAVDLLGHVVELQLGRSLQLVLELHVLDLAPDLEKLPHLYQGLQLGVA